MPVRPSERVNRVRKSVLGVPVDTLNHSETIAVIEELIQQRTPRYVVTIDSVGVLIAHENPSFFQLLQEAALVTPDSVGVVWALKRQGQHVSKVSGINLVGALCQLSANKGYRLYFLGAAPGVAEQAAEKLRLQYPGCNIVGTRHGYFPQDSDVLVAQEVAPLKPDILFVAMGMPRQELFIHNTQHIVQSPVSIGVGGSFDVLSGAIQRAPKIIQKAKLEWFWRLIMDPRKINKVKVLPRFVWKVIMSGNEH